MRLKRLPKLIPRPEWMREHTEIANSLVGSSIANQRERVMQAIGGCNSRRGHAGSARNGCATRQNFPKIYGAWFARMGQISGTITIAITKMISVSGAPTRTKSMN